MECGAQAIVEDLVVGDLLVLGQEEDAALPVEDRADRALPGDAREPAALRGRHPLRAGDIQPFRQRARCSERPFS